MNSHVYWYTEIRHVEGFDKYACVIEDGLLYYKPEGHGFDSRWGHRIFFNWPNPSSRTMLLESTQPLTEMSTRNLPGGVKNGRRVRLTTSPPSVSLLSRMWEPRRLTTLWVPTACYRDIFTPFFFFINPKWVCSYKIPIQFLYFSMSHFPPVMIIQACLL
jgi:hypothetical protein